MFVFLVKSLSLKNWIEQSNNKSHPQVVSVARSDKLDNQERGVTDPV